MYVRQTSTNAVIELPPTVEINFYTHAEKQLSREGMDYGLYNPGLNTQSGSQLLIHYRVIALDCRKLTTSQNWGGIFTQPTQFFVSNKINCL